VRERKTESKGGSTDEEGTRSTRKEGTRF